MTRLPVGRLGIVPQWARDNGGSQHMALTDSSHLFAAMHEDAFNRVLQHIMRKRPSLFNYGTQWVADQWEKRLCDIPAVDELVLRPTNEPNAPVTPDPVVTVEDPIPVLGTNGAYGLNFAAQIVGSRSTSTRATWTCRRSWVRSSPRSISSRPGAAALDGCPHPRILDAYNPPVGVDRGARDRRDPRDRHDFDDVGWADPDDDDSESVTLPTESLTCFCLDLFIVGRFEITGPPSFEYVEMKLRGLEIVDIEPVDLESNLECYLRTLAHLVLLPRLRLALSTYTFALLDDQVKVTLEANTVVPNNPAVEDDQLKVFVDMAVS